MKARLLVVSLAASLALLATACGTGGMGTDPTDAGAHGDAATFDLGDGSISVRESGHITLSGSGSPALDYSGPLGCKGRYFDADVTEHTSLDFRYSAVDAVMGVGDDVYHFGAPTQQGDELVWTGTFDHNGEPRHVVVRVTCPLPTDTTRLLPAG